MKRRLHMILSIILLLVCLSSCKAYHTEPLKAESLPSLPVFTGCVHLFGEWKTILSPTTVSNGVKTRRCEKCGYSESEEIPRMEVSFSPGSPQYVAGGNPTYDIFIGGSSPESVTPIEIVIDEIEKTVTVRTDSLPDGMSKEDLVNTVAELIGQNQIEIENFPEFEINVEIPEDQNP